MLSVAIYRDPPARVYTTSLETVLADRQRDLVDRFVKRYIKSSWKLKLFQLALMPKLGRGQPGDAALKQSLMLAALEIGITSEQIKRFGLPIEARKNVGIRSLRGDDEGVE
jgi:hypothetical protein